MSDGYGQRAIYERRIKALEAEIADLKRWHEVEVDRLNREREEAERLLALCRGRRGNQR